MSETAIKDMRTTDKKGRFKIYLSKDSLLELLIVLAIISTCVPQGISIVLPYAKNIFSMFFVVAFVGLLLMVHKKESVKFIIIMMLPIAFSMVETLLLHGDMSSLVKSAIKHWIILLSIDISFTNNICFERICYKIGLSYLVLNAISMITSPEGLANTRVGKRVFFACTDNGLSHLLLFTIFFYLECFRNRRKNRNYYSAMCVVFAISLFELIQGNSATSVVIISVYYILELIHRLIDIKTLKIWTVVITIFLNVFCLTGGKFTIFQTLFLLLGKDITISNRLFIWNSGIDMWMKTRIWGYGFWENGYYIQVGGSVFEAHNLILQQLLQGGIALLTLWIILLGYVVRAEKSKTHVIGLFVWALLFLVESPFGVYWFWICLSYIVYRCLFLREHT